MDTSKKTEPPLSVEMVQQRANPDRSPSASIYVPEQGGYKEKFVNAVEDKYKCEKCHLILCNPKQTECGHRFCETCMNGLLRYLKIIVAGENYLPFKYTAEMKTRAVKNNYLWVNYCLTVWISDLLSIGTNQQIKAHEASSAVQHVNLLKEWSNALENKRVIDSQAEKLKELDKEIRPFRQNWEEADSMKSSVESLQNRVTELESVDKTAGQGARNTSLLETQLSRHDQMLSVHDIRLADMDLRFQVLETASYNGVLIWKIRDYKRRKQEAVMGKTLSLYSQPFYTGYFGYKMCARVYLNGDGMGKGTHLSLFFVIMRGEYDALLPWPFKQKVTLMLMDQGPSRRHLGDAFKPDPNSSSFKKPTGEMNIASGCPVFVAQTVLENGTYIKDDTIFIKVIVDTSDLPDP
ncbi:tnf receptor-associated factor 3 isoform x2 [Limosa lapponica baueri]|uniref:TNF receptor-associated factor n=1 Tax=Limosa lapponica baueri TaxID=1758121 RepID=A0A2I0TTX3_LIMLA|nr:tnf receptor-associated factor 3 isoform x2 [Limosa lapponica baueri]